MQRPWRTTVAGEPNNQGAGSDNKRDLSFSHPHKNKLIKPNDLPGMKIPLRALIFGFYMAAGCASEKADMEKEPGLNRTSDTVSWHPHNCDRVKLAEIELSPKRILKVEGDFNGDGKSETLYEYYFDTLTAEPLDSIPNENLRSWQTYYETETWLISSDKAIPPLKLPGNNNWGILSLIHLGDVNNDNVHEIAVVVDHADFSNLNSCFIYQYCNPVWKELFSYSIHEQAFYYTDDFDVSRFESEIPGFLEKRSGAWYYYNYDDFWGAGVMTDENGEPEMRPLKLKRVCIQSMTDTFPVL